MNTNELLLLLSGGAFFVLSGDFFLSTLGQADRQTGKTMLLSRRQKVAGNLAGCSKVSPNQVAQVVDDKGQFHRLLPVSERASERTNERTKPIKVVLSAG